MPEADTEAKKDDLKDMAVKVARATFRKEFKASNPEASPEQIKEGWQNSRKDYIKAARQNIRSVERPAKAGKKKAD